MSAWTYLAIGIVLEVIGTSCLKFSQGFSHLLPGIAGLVCFLFALICINMVGPKPTVYTALYQGVFTTLRIV